MSRSMPRATPLLALVTVVALIVALGSGAAEDDGRRTGPLADMPGAAAGEHPTAGTAEPEIAELRTRLLPGASHGGQALGSDGSARRGGAHGHADPPSARSRPGGISTDARIASDGGSDAEAAASTLEPTGTSEEGFEVAPGGPAAGDGETVRYTVEVEPGLGEDLGATVAVVEDALHDPRSWAADVRLERTGDPDEARIRVVLASPDTVDRLCAQAGLDTVGVFSCWNETFAALNSMRWNDGADAFGDLETYRRYLVNHEVGHGLGRAHVDCPRPGEPAPVMMQQTMGTDGCEANGWVYPDVFGP